ncbi:MAG: efflux RND transporter periplasmic adaptor subunit [Lachnospiraceae bacterium]|nr:efflux RND transporter periplasmic adaptor subunit [Lachnospiraceae bacterium]
MKKAVGLTVIAALLLTGCGLFPAEEEMRKAPVVAKVEEEYFSTAEVKVGNIRDYVSERCSYQYQMTQNLAFEVGGESLKEVYVVLGQKVFAGDVLAELSVESIEEELENSRELCAQLEEESAYYEGMLSIEKEREALAKRYGKTYDQNKLKKATNAYEECAGRKYIAELRLGELEADVNGRRLVAGIDGIVDYIREIPAWFNGRVNAREKFISIHSERTGFVIPTLNDSIYHFGDVFTIVTEVGSYECEVVKINRPTVGMGGRTNVVLEPLHPDENLYIGLNGDLIIETGTRTDVVYIPTYALRNIDGKPAVYVTDANGIRSLRYIEIGLSVEGKSDPEENRTEVISGLKPGENVILRGGKKS